MSSSDEPKPRGPPMEIMLLDEIAGKLSDLLDFETTRQPEGVTEPIEPIVVSDVRRIVRAVKPWISLMIFNDGPEDVWVIVNSEKSVEPHLVRAGETYNVNAMGKVIKDTILYCEHGLRSSIRLVGIR